MGSRASLRSNNLRCPRATSSSCPEGNGPLLLRRARQEEVVGSPCSASLAARTSRLRSPERALLRSALGGTAQCLGKRRDARQYALLTHVLRPGSLLNPSEAPPRSAQHIVVLRSPPSVFHRSRSFLPRRSALPPSPPST